MPASLYVRFHRPLAGLALLRPVRLVGFAPLVLLSSFCAVHDLCPFLPDFRANKKPTGATSTVGLDYALSVQS
jgi:hypothetical protein